MNTRLEQFHGRFQTNNLRPALIDTLSSPGEPRTFSYAELGEQAARVASLLSQQGLGPGDRLAVMLPNSLDLVLLYLGCLHGGITVIPLNPELPAHEVAFLLQLSQAKRIVTREQNDNLDIRAMELWQLGEKGLIQQAAHLPPAPWQAGDEHIIGIFFTSGTTSRPKAVCHLAWRMLDNAATFAHHMGWNEDLRLLHVLPMSYMAGFLNTILVPFMAGGCVVLAPRFDARSALSFWQPVMSQQANAVWLSPTMLALLSRLQRDPGVVRWTRANPLDVCVGTAPLPAAVRMRFEEEFGLKTYQSYGMSEILLVAGQRPGHHCDAGSVGSPLPGIKIQLRGQQKALWVNTPHALAGYLDPDRGELISPLTDGWMDTGDLAKLDETGCLSITGRKKDLIIHGGHNVSPAAVEACLLQLEGVEDAAVIGLPHDFHGEEVVALVIARADHDWQSLYAELLAHCRRELPPHARPTRFIQRRDFPRSVTGKIQKHLLRQDCLGTAGAATP